MAALFEREQIGIKRTGHSVTIPNNPTARLMYYFDCVCSCVADSNEPEIQRLRNYSNYYSLSNEDESMLLILCLALSPDKLIGEVFFPAEDIPNSTNAFYELSAVSTKMVVSESLLIGGQRKRVQKIMMFEKIWLERNFLEPIKAFANKSVRGQSRAALPAPRAYNPPRPAYNPPPRQQPARAPVYNPPLRQQPARAPVYNPPPRQQSRAPTQKPKPVIQKKKKSSCSLM